MAQLTTVFSLAQLNALGGVTAGSIDFGGALPADARIINASARNGGTAFGSSGGTVTGLTVNVVATGQTTVLTSNINGLHAASVRGQNGCVVSAAASQAAYPFEAGFTPAARFSVGGSGVTLGNLTGGNDGIEVTVTYL